MDRVLIKVIISICAKSILLAAIIAGGIGVIGYLNEWTSPLPYSNAFFLAGALVMISGGLSRQAAGGDWDNFQLLNAESFRNMSSGERADLIVNASSSMRFLILSLLTGILLILISVILANIS